MEIKDRFVATSTVPLPYLLTTPTGFDPAAESLPLLVFLHGAGERGEDLELLKIYGPAKLFTQDPDYLGLRAITLSPQCPNGCVWNHLVSHVYELILSVAQQYNVDRSRISLTGLSMGGFGTWDMGCAYPELFSALGPICGGGQAFRAAALKNMPIRAFHGDADPTVPISASQEMVAAVTRAGGSVDFTVYPGVGHNSWDAAYEQTDLIPWLISRKRPD